MTKCQNCSGTGWTCYEVPGAIVDGIIRMRERITPCHICNAGGSWGRWAQNVVDAGRVGDGEQGAEKP